MGRRLVITLTDSDRAALEQGYRTGSSHSFRQRCRMILLKSTGKLTKEICQTVCIKSENQVNKWIKRYQTSYAADGLNILHNTAGQGRKPIFDTQKDIALIKDTVQQERQRLNQAKAILEQELGKHFNLKTLKRFLKKITADTNDSDDM